ncbi:alpha-amylase [Corynebacterium uropygiale]|uniref:Alpha-amylase n=1 Tax=Corynebacterium uropygiale TaxID=1775911 RepID=A0A9X1QQC2_9CORY|nr:alpha-amylase [Corynebacterium uropygiale]
MSNLEHTIIWQVYPLSADLRQLEHPEDGSQSSALRRTTAWLDYVQQLGCDALMLGPIFRSVSHGYDTLDHYAIDPRVGTEEDARTLIAECHARGIRVIFDGVFNHVAATHPLVSSGGPIKRTEAGDPVPWEGHEELVELDHSDPRTADMVTDIMLHWLRLGLDGWRLDVAYAVPTAFWAEVTDRVRAEFPQAIFLGEMIHGDYVQLIDEGHLDSATQYELWKAIWSSIKDKNFWELAHALERHEEFSRGHILNIFVGNHDVDRIASVVGDGGAALAACFLFTLPGCPSIYYGDEQAFRGEKGEGFGADDPIRPPLPESPEKLAEQGKWLWQVYHDLIAARRRHPWMSTATLEVRSKDNERIEYALSSAEGELTVQVDISEKFRAHLAWSDGEELRYCW